jgi:uncharacterized membrane protein
MAGTILCNCLASQWHATGKELFYVTVLWNCLMELSYGTVLWNCLVELPYGTVYVTVL